MQIFLGAISFLWEFILNWWWVFAPFLLLKWAVFLWQRWTEEGFYNSVQFSLLELRMPREVIKPIKAMESVFSGLWQLYDPANPREHWFEGKRLLPLSVEIVSSEGETHMYLWIPTVARRMVESAVYSQYPEVEIEEVEDYVRQVPKDVPNKEWEVYGINFRLAKGSVYPIKTYPMFFEENPEGKEEKRLDPMSMLFESMTKLGAGEHLWVQIVLVPITTGEHNYVEEGTDEVNKLVKRPPAQRTATFAQDVRKAATLAVTGRAENGMDPREEQREIIPPEMRLTPGERHVVEEVERKVSKHTFEAYARFVYLARRENYFGPTKALGYGFFNQFATQDMNMFLPFSPSNTKVHTVTTWFLDKRRAFLRKRRMMRNYAGRLPPNYPRPGGTFLLNVEELATMFHFPGQIVAPLSNVPRVESKKGEAPPELPRE